MKKLVSFAVLLCVPLSLDLAWAEPRAMPAEELAAVTGGLLDFYYISPVVVVSSTNTTQASCEPQQRRAGIVGADDQRRHQHQPHQHYRPDHAATAGRRWQRRDAERADAGLGPLAAAAATARRPARHADAAAVMGRCDASLRHLSYLRLSPHPNSAGAC